MSTFAITPDHNIIVYPSKKEAEAINPEATFGSLQELAKLAVGWPSSRLVELWNGIPGLEPVKKFTSRDIAVSRIWRALQKLDAGAAASQDEAPEAAPSRDVGQGRAPKAKGEPKAKAAKKGAPKAKGPREGSKKAIILGLVSRKDGATLQELMKATDWQAHSVRGFISNLVRKAGYKVESVKREDGERAYLIPAKFRAALQALDQLAQAPSRIANRPPTWALHRRQPTGGGGRYGRFPFGKSLASRWLAAFLGLKGSHILSQHVDLRQNVLVPQLTFCGADVGAVHSRDNPVLQLSYLCPNLGQQGAILQAHVLRSVLTPVRPAKPGHRRPVSAIAC